MTSKLELFSRGKMNHLYLTESMLTYRLQMLDEYWDEKDTPYSDYFYLWPDGRLDITMNFCWEKPLRVRVSLGIHNSIE